MSELQKYSVEEFRQYINSLNISRRICLIQLHHTYLPAYKQFSGDNHTALQVGMRNYHIKTNGWSDIGQHFTIFPDGIIMSGRSMEKIPAGIKGANTGAICIECLGNFDTGKDIMTNAQREAIVSAVKILLEKFSLNPKDAVIYHGWWTASGTKIGDYKKGRSAKTCPGTNFFGGNTREAFENNLLPMLEECEKKDNKDKAIKELIAALYSVGIISDTALWVKKCRDDKNVYWLCKKMVGYVNKG